MTILRNTWRILVAQMLVSAAMIGALLLGATGVNTVRAEDNSPAAAATAAPKKLTNEELKAIYENLGFEPEEDKIGDKINLLYLQWKQGTFQYVMYVSISNDGNDLILQSPLKPLPADEAAYGKELAAVMAKGFLTTPSHFVVDESRMLRLIRFVPAQGLTPAKIRKATADFTEQVRSSENVWRADRWEAKPTLVAKPIVP